MSLAGLTPSLDRCTLCQLYMFLQKRSGGQTCERFCYWWANHTPALAYRQSVKINHRPSLAQRAFLCHPSERASCRREPG